MPPPTLRIGVEVEVVYKLRRNQKKEKKLSPREAARNLVKSYNQIKESDDNEMLAEWNKPEDGLCKDSWVAIEDSSIKTEETDEYVLEFSSPILDTSQRAQASIRKLFSILNTTYIFSVNDSCGTHVHVSVLGRPWNIGDLKRIARAIIYFDAAWEFLLPPNRRKNIFALHNLADNDGFSGLLIIQALDRIAEIETTELLAELMNGGPNYPMDQRRYFRWNFQNVLPNKIGTIEFRGGEGSANAGDALMWADAASTFLRASLNAMSISGVVYGFEANVGGLRKFMKAGETRSAMAWEKLFENKEDDGMIVARAHRLCDAEKAARLQKQIVEDIKNGVAGMYFRR